MKAAFKKTMKRKPHQDYGALITKLLRASNRGAIDLSEHKSLIDAVHNALRGKSDDINQYRNAARMICETSNKGKLANTVWNILQPHFTAYIQKHFPEAKPAQNDPLPLEVTSAFGG